MPSPFGRRLDRRRWRGRRRSRCRLSREGSAPGPRRPEGRCRRTSGPRAGADRRSRSPTRRDDHQQDQHHREVPISLAMLCTVESWSIQDGDFAGFGRELFGGLAAAADLFAELPKSVPISRTLHRRGRDGVTAAVDDLQQCSWAVLFALAQSSGRPAIPVPFRRSAGRAAPRPRQLGRRAAPVRRQRFSSSSSTSTFATSWSDQEHRHLALHVLRFRAGGSWC